MLNQKLMIMKWQKKEASDLMKRLEIKKDNLKIFTDKYLKEMMKK